MNYFFSLKLVAKVAIISKINKNWLKRLKIGQKAKMAIIAKIAIVANVAIIAKVDKRLRLTWNST